MDVEPRRMSHPDLHPVLTVLMLKLVAWVYVLMLIAAVQVAVLGLQASFGPAFFLPQRVRCSIQSDPDLLMGFLRVGSSRIPKGMITTRHYQIRKVAPWAIVRFAWTR